MPCRNRRCCGTRSGLDGVCRSRPDCCIVRICLFGMLPEALPESPRRQGRRGFMVGCCRDLDCVAVHRHTCKMRGEQALRQTGTAVWTSADGIVLVLNCQVDNNSHGSFLDCGLKL